MHLRNEHKKLQPASRRNISSFIRSWTACFFTLVSYMWKNMKVCRCKIELNWGYICYTINKEFVRCFILLPLLERYDTWSQFLIVYIYKKSASLCLKCWLAYKKLNSTISKMLVSYKLKTYCLFILTQRYFGVYLNLHL